MTSPQAILIGAAMIAASIILVNSIRPAEAQHVGPYQLVHHSNTTANVGVFRIDVSSGDVSYCYLSANSELLCTKTVK